MSRAPVASSTGAAVTALTPVVAAVVERAGLVLDDLDVHPAGRRLVVRVTVDSPDLPEVDDGPAPGADLDAVAAISRDVSAAVDAHEQEAGAVLDGAYTLEVSTPGTDRPLTEVRHWRRAWLRAVGVTLTDGTALTGRVGPVAEPAAASVPDAGTPDTGTPTPAVVTLVTDGALREVPLDTVARAGVVVEFKPAPEAEVELLRAARRGEETA